MDKSSYIKLIQTVQSKTDSAAVAEVDMLFDGEVMLNLYLSQ